MTSFRNAGGQPVGLPVAGWSARARPRRQVLEGRHVRLEPLDAGRHAAQLYAAQSTDASGVTWTYLLYGPFADLAGYEAWMRAACLDEGSLFVAVVDRRSGRAVGLASYLRIDPANGSIEIGHIYFSPALQRTPAATEALVLMIAHVFDDLGYRRCEWKCDSLNGPSRRAATRLGFRYEGTFRQSQVVKGRNRDTAWYSILDREWPALRGACAIWLAADNFDAAGRQRRRLSELTAEARATLPP